MSSLISFIPSQPPAWDESFLQSLHPKQQILTHADLVTYRKTEYLCCRFYRYNDQLSPEIHPFAALFISSRSLNARLFKTDTQPDNHSDPVTWNSCTLSLIDTLYTALTNTFCSALTQYWHLQSLTSFDNPSVIDTFFRKYSKRFYRDPFTALTKTSNPSKYNYLHSSSSIKNCIMDVDPVPAAFHQWIHQQFDYRFLSFSRKKVNVSFTCPHCHSTFQVDSIRNKTMIQCPHCEQNLELISNSNARYLYGSDVRRFWFFQRTPDTHGLMLRQFIYVLHYDNHMHQWENMRILIHPQTGVSYFSCIDDVYHGFCFSNILLKEKYQYNSSFSSFLNNCSRHMEGLLWTGNLPAELDNTRLKTLSFPSDTFVNHEFLDFIHHYQPGEPAEHLMKQNFSKIAFHAHFYPDFVCSTAGKHKTRADKLLNIPTQVYKTHLPAIQSHLNAFNWKFYLSLWRTFGSLPFGPECIDLIYNSKCDYSIQHLLDQLNNFPAFRCMHSLQPLYRYLQFLTTDDTLTSRQKLDLYKDYLNSMFHMPLHPTKHELFPERLTAAHDEMTERYTQYLAEKNKLILEERNKDLKMVAQACQPLHYQNDQLMLTFPESSADFEQESRQMHNCVVNYQSNVQHHDTLIAFIRPVDHPNQSLCTLELKNWNISQLYAYHNTPPDPSVTQFVNEWHKNKILPLKKKYSTTFGQSKFLDHAVASLSEKGASACPF